MIPIFFLLQCLVCVLNIGNTFCFPLVASPLGRVGKSNTQDCFTLVVDKEQNIDKIAKFCVETFYEVGLPGSLDSDEVNEIIEFEKKGMTKRANSSLETLMISAISTEQGNTFENGKMIGFAETTKMNDQEALIRNVCTSLEYRRQGVGRSLMKACMDYAQYGWNCKKCILNVEDENEKAIYFYKSLGFSPIPGRDLFGSIDMQIELVS